MNKRILTLVLALVMVFSLAVSAFAAPAEAEKITNPKVQWLIDKNIVEGRLQEDGKTKVFDLDKTITREEVTKMVIFYRGSEHLARALAGTKGIFTDVAIDRWSNGFINAAQVDKLIEGYPDKSFKPEGDITYAEVAAILVRMNSKWTAADEKNAQWPVSYIKAAEEFGILKDVKIADVNAKAVREDVFNMMYNAMDGKYQAPIVNDKLGVVSRVWMDGLQLNGKDDFKVTRSTVFVGTDMHSLYKVDDFYGALVRIAVNNDNEITHVVILGNNGVAQEIARWKGIAEKAVISGDIKDTTDNDTIVFADGTKLVTNDKTRVFVADKGAKNFYEAKKITDAIDVKKETHLKGVYAAYDQQPVTDKLVARVIVFSSGKEPKANKDLVRVTANVNSTYKFMAEDTKAAEKEYDISKYTNLFPADYGFEKMDVLSLTRQGENGVSKVTMKIDYSKDGIFEVTKVGDMRYNHDGTASFRGNAITLKDVKNREAEFAFALDGVSVFTHGLAVGNHVQIHFADDENKVIDIVSKVDAPLRGDLPRGEYIKVCGKLENAGLVNDQYAFFIIDGKTYHVPMIAHITVKNLVGGCEDACAKADWEVAMEDFFSTIDWRTHINCPECATIECLPTWSDNVNLVTNYTWAKLLIGKEVCFLKDNAHDSDKYIYNIEIDSKLYDELVKFGEDYKAQIKAFHKEWFAWLDTHNQVAGPTFEQGEEITEAEVIAKMTAQLNSIPNHPDFVVTKAEKVQNTTDQWDITVEIKMDCAKQVQVLEALFNAHKLPLFWEAYAGCLDHTIDPFVLRVTCNVVAPESN